MRFKLLFVALLSLMLVFSFAVAHEEATTETDEEKHFHLDELLESTEELNAELQENEVMIPSALGFIIKDGNIAVNISMNSGSVEGLYVIIDKSRITNVINGFPEKSNYGVITDEETINSILESEDLSGEILNAYDREDIRIEANGLGNKIKLFFGKIFLKIFT